MKYTENKNNFFRAVLFCSMGLIGSLFHSTANGVNTSETQEMILLIGQLQRCKETAVSCSEHVAWGEWKQSGCRLCAPGDTWLHPGATLMTHRGHTDGTLLVVYTGDVSTLSSDVNNSCHRQLRDASQESTKHTWLDTMSSSGHLLHKSCSKIRHVICSWNRAPTVLVSNIYYRRT